MTRPRFTLRIAMLLVASVGSSFGIARMMEDRKARLLEAAAHKDFRDMITASPASVSYWEMRWTDQQAGNPHPIHCLPLLLSSRRS